MQASASINNRIAYRLPSDHQKDLQAAAMATIIILVDGQLISSFLGYLNGYYGDLRGLPALFLSIPA